MWRRQVQLVGSVNRLGPAAMEEEPERGTTDQAASISEGKVLTS